GGTGTVQFGSGPNNGQSSYLYANGTTLTIGSGITVQGPSGRLIGSTIINQGTIHANAAGSGIVINPNTWTNQGTIQASNGGSMSLISTWVDAGAIVANGGTVNLGGAFTLASQASF